MAGYGWNLRNDSTHETKRHTIPTKIACRICDQVFMSTQTLIDHIETHMKKGNPIPPSRSLNLMSLQNDPLPTPFPSNKFSPQTPFSQTPSLTQLNAFNNSSPIFGPNPTMLSHPIAYISSKPPLSKSGKTRSHRTAVASQQPLLGLETHCGLMEQPLGDCTKPFLKQLEKPISYNGLDLNRRVKNADEGEKTDVGMLDLDLKL